MAMNLDVDLCSIQEARRLVEEAVAAQRLFATYDAESVDRIVAAMARAGEVAADTLARLAVEETGFGVIEHKAFKNRFASRYMYESIKDVKTVGVIWHDRQKRVMGVAEPVGVIAALVPVTGPTSTVILKSIIALKGRNAVVFAPHPRSPRSAQAAARIMSEAACSQGAPRGLISCMENISLSGTNELLRHKGVSMVLGTGGLSMIHAVYGSGKPAIAVGPGNVPAYVDRSVKDLRRAVKGIIASKTFDNGTPCAAEQAIVADFEIAGALRNELKAQGGYFLSQLEKKALQKTVALPDGTMNPVVVGQSPQKLAALAGFSVPASCTVLVAELDNVGPSEPLSAEILTTLMGFYEVSDYREGLQRCNQLLDYGGTGHTCSIWAESREAVALFAAKVRAFRLVVNCPTAQGSIGYLTGIEPSLMLGTGTWGGSVTSDNISARHLINVRKVAYCAREPDGIHGVDGA